MVKVKVTIRKPEPVKAEPRIRVRVNPGANPAPKKVALKVSVNEDTKALLTLGEIDTKSHPRKWARWPNGSLVMNRQQKHVGRTIRANDGEYHSLRWIESKAVYLYAGKHPWPKAMDVLVR